MDDIWSRFAHNLAARITGPMQFRVVLQPLVAAGLGIIGVAVAIAAAAPLIVPASHVRAVLEQRASAAIGRRVTVGDVRVSLLRGAVTAATVAVADDPAFGTSPFLTARSVTIGVERWPLLASRTIRVTSITVDSPELTLLHPGADRWNTASIGATSSALSGSVIGKVDVSNGRLIVVSDGQRRTYDNLDLTASRVSANSRWPIVATATGENGRVSLTGDVGPFDKTSLALTPFNAMLGVEGLDLATRGAVGVPARRAGILDVMATLASSGGKASASGRAVVSRLLLAGGGSPAGEPLTIDFSSTYDIRKNLGTVNPSTMRMGMATATVHGTYDTAGPETKVDITVPAAHLPADQIESVLPVFGVHLPKDVHLAGGTVEANLSVTGPVNVLGAAGDVGLFNTRLSGFDLGSAVNGVAKTTLIETGNNLDVRSMTAQVGIGADGMRFEHLYVVLPSLGHLRGAATIDAAQHVNAAMVATLSEPRNGVTDAPVGTTGRVADLTGVGIPVAARELRLPFFVEGTTAAPTFLPDAKGLVTQLLERR